MVHARRFLKLSTRFFKLRQWFGMCLSGRPGSNQAMSAQPLGGVFVRSVTIVRSCNVVSL